MIREGGLAHSLRQTFAQYKQEMKGDSMSHMRCDNKLSESNALLITKEKGGNRVSSSDVPMPMPMM